MVKFVVILTLVAVCLGSLAFAQGSGLGLGIIIGEPTGLSFKSWTGPTTAVAGGIAWSFGDRDALHLHIDYLLHNFSLFPVGTGKLPLYYGIGGRVKLVANEGKSKADNQIGVRIPVGISYIFSGASIDIFFELVPVFDLAPSTGFGLDEGIGIRYFF
ncbi:hypothetical protein HYR99_02030 [Candidatus Poribacteria bacterium]|nr:hypothetical protein [Candidatus Poribacteria bacterium]